MVTATSGKKPGLRAGRKTHQIPRAHLGRPRSQGRLWAGGRTPGNLSTTVTREERGPGVLTLPP